MDCCRLEVPLEKNLLSFLKIYVSLLFLHYGSTNFKALESIFDYLDYCCFHIEQEEHDDDDYYYLHIGSFIVLGHLLFHLIFFHFLILLFFFYFLLMLAYKIFFLFLIIELIYLIFFYFVINGSIISVFALFNY